LCQEANIPVKTVPGIFELLDGSVTVNQLRPVDIADLLRREPVETDKTQVAELLRGKRVLVTGAGGSIGSELCRQIAHCEPARLILLGHGENSLFQISNELCHGYPRLLLQTIVADIRDGERLTTIFEREQPQVVFHAAAHKHVPMMEANIEDAVTNNVLGTRNVLDVAAQTGVTHFVLISTDKAVNPTSVMGSTKRVGELLVQQAAVKTGRSFVAVRFGNVLGSRGSVVPLFKEQIARGGPVTVTHPEIRRYFMTIPEAVQLVVQAAALGKGGEIFVLDMGEPVKIVDMARELIHLSGLEEGKDIDIEFTGLRPGEKLFEELFLSEEDYERTQHSKIFISRNIQSVDSSRLDALIAAARRGASGEVCQLLHQIVPEYRSPDTNTPFAQPLTVPTNAIRTIGTRKYIRVLRDGNPQSVEVQVGSTTGHRTEILSGWAGDEVIETP
jgi:FlaA1/EpsC-like NDP-sugar epimerase